MKKKKETEEKKQHQPKQKPFRRIISLSTIDVQVVAPLFRWCKIPLIYSKWNWLPLPLPPLLIIIESQCSALCGNGKII